MLNKRDIKFFIMGIALSAIVLITSVSFADSSILKQLYVDYNAITKIVVDGVEKTSPDDMKPFVADGKVFVELQYIADALGKKADFDKETGIITIDSPTSHDNNPVNSEVPSKKTLNVWSFVDEVPKIVEKYISLHPEFPYKIKTNLLSSSDGAYEPALDAALAAGGANAPDIYCAESAFAQKYTQGSAAKYAAPYKDLGIDVDKLLKEAEIAQYTVDIGTRPSDKKVVALAYQATGSVCIYRRSIAKAVWGTDNPKIIKTKIGPGLNQFFKAAGQLKAKGYGIVSGDGDIWRMIEGSSPTGWVVKGRLNIDPTREKFLDYSKMLKVNGWSNNTLDWTDAWYADMRDAGKKGIFSFFGPEWLLNYIIDGNSGGRRVGEGTYGDWAICEPPAGFSWGGTWLIGNKDTKEKAAVGSILKWITLDSSDTGLQYIWANGYFYPDMPKGTVPSGTVMKESDGKLDFLGGQNIFEVFVPANALVTGKNKTQYDDAIDVYWREAVRQYVNGNVTRKEAIAQFKKKVFDNIGIN
ncbi:MAG TPA: carbohydrate ABC transporter substrate-binding protein [Clostridia bacterium]|nr:carbohydrate ABC transporter substrate-binding protein [Clostridia bacterium]